MKRLRIRKWLRLAGEGPITITVSNEMMEKWGIKNLKKMITLNAGKKIIKFEGTMNEMHSELLEVMMEIGRKKKRLLLIDEAYMLFADKDFKKTDELETISPFC